MNRKLILFFLLFFLLVSGGYLIFTRASVFLPTSSEVNFDPNKHLKITIIDAVTGKGVDGVPIYFLNDCQLIATNDSTCGGKYENVASGKTNSNGVFIVVKNEQTPPPGVLHFQIGKKLGYNTDIGTGTFVWEDGARSEVVYKIISSSKSSGAVVTDENSAIAAVETDEKFKFWKSQMEKIEEPNTDVRDGKWRVYYQGVKNNSGDWIITFYIDPQTGNVISYEEPMQKVLVPSQN